MPSPLLPDWDGACLHRVVPGLLGHLADPERRPLPPWFPAPVAGATQIVLLVIDGLGAEQLRERQHAGADAARRGTGGPITSVAPSTTACALTTLVTGRVPGRARRGRVPGGARRRGDERPAVVGPRGRRPHARAGARVPAVRVVSRAGTRRCPS